MAVSMQPPPGESQLTETTNLRWYQGISTYAWMVLAVAALGWMFDSMDQNIFNLVRLPSLIDILRETNQSMPQAQVEAAAKAWGGTATAIFLLGWAAGGFLFGMIGDRLGRTKTMALTIITYAVFTGLSGLTHTTFAYCLCRFMTALGVGGEFAAGASLVAEVFPNRSRAMALGALQSLSTVGNMMAALVTLGLSNVASSWRWAFAIGALPAVLVYFIMRRIEEPQKWVAAKAKADAGDEAIGTIAGLFQDPVLRRSTIAGTMLAIAGVGGLWGVGFWSPDFITSVLKNQHLSAPAISQFKSYMFLIQQVGALFGMISYSILSERIGRRPALAIVFGLAFISIQCFFHLVTNQSSALLWAPILGFCTLAPFASYSIYFPELFPTRLRSTGIGFCYNCGRIIAATAPFALGKLAQQFDVPTDAAAGMRTAASIVSCIYIVGFIGLALAPETRGRPLPE